MLELSNSNLGIIVIDSIGFFSRDFIRSLYQEQEGKVLPKIEVAWIKRPEWERSSDPLTLRYGIYDISFGEQYTLHLTSFPSALRKDFPLDALQFPFKITGVIFLADLTGIIIKPEELIEHFEWLLRTQEDHGLIWAKNLNLPLVISAIHTGSPYIPIDTLHELLDLDADVVPIIPYHIEPKDIDPPGYSGYRFTYEHIQMVLSALVQQF